nr:ATP-binding cassette domain-containing protein [Galbitalea soli]
MTIRRGSRVIYDDVSIAFDSGVTAILGPNGAGKTTLLEALLTPPRAGNATIRFVGARVDDSDSFRAFLAGVGYMPQDWTYFSGFTARESVEYAAWLKGARGSSVRSVASAALDSVDLTAFAHVKVRRLSGGLKQRVGLAEAFVNDPRAVLLDEPTVGLDPAQRASYRRFLRGHATDRAVVISTHLTDDVEAIADRVVVIAAGRIIFDGAPAELAAHGTRTEGTASALEAGYLSVVGANAPAQGRL